VYTRGAAGIWAMHFFGSAYFDEIIIFGLSKYQIFRIWSTFTNPEQFLILVTHLNLNENFKNIDQTKLPDLYKILRIYT
jgi:hypothetical protein